MPIPHAYEAMSGRSAPKPQPGPIGIVTNLSHSSIGDAPLPGVESFSVVYL